VTDPAHPLFGRRFPVVSVSSTGHRCAMVAVSYRQNMVLRIPISATNLVGSQPVHQTKLTLVALTELISLAEHWEGNHATHAKRSLEQSVSGTANSNHQGPFVGPHGGDK
jgi:hypothetical protein